MSWKGLREGAGPGPGQGALSLASPPFLHPDSSLTSDPPLALVPPLSSAPMGLPALSSASKFTPLFSYPKGRERPGGGEPRCEPVPRREGKAGRKGRREGWERRHCLRQWPSWGAA